MRQEEEIQLWILEQFYLNQHNGKIPFIYFENHDDYNWNISSVELKNLRDYGYIVEPGNPRQNHEGYEITKSGLALLKRLKQKKEEIEIAAIRDNETRTIIMQVNKSVLTTNKHQRFNMWVMAGIAVFASWVAYNQLSNDNEQKHQATQEQQLLQKMQSRIQALTKSLDSMRVALTSDTTSKKK